jgi:hypothetical protein
MLLVSAAAGRLPQWIGPRIPMAAGPVIVAGGLVLLTRVSPGGRYLGDVLPGVLVVAAGLTLTVDP